MLLLCRSVLFSNAENQLIDALESRSGFFQSLRCDVKARKCERVSDVFMLQVGVGDESAIKSRNVANTSQHRAVSWILISLRAI